MLTASETLRRSGLQFQFLRNKALWQSANGQVGISLHPNGVATGLARETFATQRWTVQKCKNHEPSALRGSQATSARIGVRVADDVRNAFGREGRPVGTERSYYDVMQVLSSFGLV